MAIEIDTRQSHLSGQTHALPDNQEGGDTPGAAHKPEARRPQTALITLSGLTLLAAAALAFYETRILSSAADFPPTIMQAGNRPAAGAVAWRMEAVPPARATLSTTGSTLQVNVAAIDGTDWHVQLYRTGTKVQDGQTCTAQFRARAEGRCQILVYASVDQEDYHRIGLAKQVTVTPAWETYRLTFKARNVHDKAVRIPSFCVGKHIGRLWLADVTLKVVG